MPWGMVSRTAATCMVGLCLIGPAPAAAMTPQAGAQKSTPPKPTTPQGQPVNADAKAMAAFQDRIKDYMALHNTLEATLPSLPKEANPQQIDQHQRSLLRLLQGARRGAKQGDLFTPDIRRVVRRLMAQVFGGADGRQLRDSINDENPGPLRIAVNSRYPDAVPLSTVPPQVLAGMPKLPDELEYRFLGRRLILMDVHAHAIVDFIDNALPA